uniref:Uncharacterized protein n=1 Tax=Meloidogyne floridensis TaxID=298350 RepID=A0A915NRM3_9BILA
LNEAVIESRGLGLNPEQIGCVISSEVLNHDIWIPVRDRNENTVEAILNRFLLVAQSFRQKDISLWGQPFNVTATVVDKNSLPKQQQLPGSGRNKKIATIRNNDYFCLFYALVATLVHSIFDWSSKKFQRYIRSEHGMAKKLREDAMELMDNIGAPLDLDLYNAEDWI